MGGRFVRSGSNNIRQLLERRSLDSHHISIETHLLSNQNQQTYARSLLLNYNRHRVVVSEKLQQQWRRSYCSSTSTSVLTSKKNGFVGWYMGLIESRPILTKSITSGLIYTAADSTSQMVTPTSSEFSYDWIRTLRMAGYGMIVMGPALHCWFNFVSKILPKTDILNTMKKILLGQTVFGPIMTTLFFSANAGVQGENAAQIVARLKRDLLPTFKNGLLYWPMCDFITFKFIPVRLQPLISNSFAYLWTIYITYMASLEKASPSSISVKKPQLIASQ
ncbi:hypothetical protein GIB67_030001 [Kingdonia uniflora]|uniref:PXMP2/4 family protein 4 n=1 Tax=Kingdonia uniflora TaxID=39325 RepID=A0A7J7MXX5_9MAGN|nr:hypothetical protein GIB67_030001 [Kingdonia uniflora]